MDIAGLSTALANVSLQSQVSVAVLNKAMDTSKVLGDRMVEMMDAAAMELSVNPDLGAYFDVRV